MADSELGPAAKKLRPSADGADGDAGGMAEEASSRPASILVWDLDETLIVFQSLISGTYVRHWGHLCPATSSATSSAAAHGESTDPIPPELNPDLSAGPGHVANANASNERECATSDPRGSDNATTTEVPVTGGPPRGSGEGEGVGPTNGGGMGEGGESSTAEEGPDLALSLGQEKLTLSHWSSVLGVRWEQLILEVADNHFFFRHLQENDQPWSRHLLERGQGMAGNDQALGRHLIGQGQGVGGSDQSLSTHLIGQGQGMAGGEEAAGRDYSRLSDGLVGAIRKLGAIKEVLSAEQKREWHARQADVKAWMIKCYRHMEWVYRQGLDAVLSEDQKKEWAKLYEETDRFTNGWLSAGLKVIGSSAWSVDLSNGSSVAAPSHGSSTVVNAVVSSGQLIPTLVKLMLFKINPLVAPENVYSAREVGKATCFRWLDERFGGAGVKFTALGDGSAERDASLLMSWPFIPLGGHHCHLALVKVLEKSIC